MMSLRDARRIHSRAYSRLRRCDRHDPRHEMLQWSYAEACELTSNTEHRMGIVPEYDKECPF